MRRIAISLLLATMLAAPALPLSASQMRGMWVDAFHPGFKSAEQTTHMVARAKTCNFTDLFVQVRRRGDVYFNSAIEPMASDVKPGYDPLADIVAKAHAAGIKVHAWMTTYEVYHDNKWAVVRKDQVHEAHPEWLMKDDRGRASFADGRAYLDPGLPEVRRYLAAIVNEIVSGYEVDGVHLDCVRYPNEHAGYNEDSVSKFQAQNKVKDKPASGDDAWGDWRRSQVTEFTKMAKDVIKKSKRDVALSAAVSANRTDSYFGGFQDWVGWLKSGLLDFTVAMVFPTDDRVFQAEVADLLKVAGPKTLYIGQAGWRMSSKHSLKQIDMALEAGAPGIVIYSYDGCRSAKKGEKSPLLEALNSHLSAR